METEVLNTVDTPTTPVAAALETKWYVLRVVSGKEKKIKELEDRLGAKLQRALDNPLAN